MGPKLLFLIGIVVAHGAVGAALLSHDTPRAQPLATSCVKTPDPLPYFEPKRELLAMVVFTTPPEDPTSP
jgi:hypothetical protein